MKRIIGLCITFLLSIVFGNAQNVGKKIDNYVATVSERYKIPGAAVAVIQDGKVIHKKYYGKANLESGEPVTEKTFFKLHSLSKVFVATAIFQLIEEEKLSLEDDVGMYIDGLPETWQKVKIKHVLSHSSGLPDMVRYEASNEEEHKAKVFGGAIEFEPGDRFSYNQTNFWLLNRIITKVTKGSFEKYIISHQFDGDENALVFAQDAKAKNRATEYFPNSDGAMEAKEFDVPEYMYGAAGIALTLNEFIKWNENLDANVLLKPETKAMMWSPFTYKNGHEFAYGWGMDMANGHKAMGFSGGTIVSLRKFIEDDITVIVLTTGYRFFSGVNRSAIHIAGMVDENLIDRDIAIRLQLMDHILGGSFEETKLVYYKLKVQYPKADFEAIINSIGYEMSRRNKFADSLGFFQLNAQEYPDSWNVWDSLGEGYEMSGDTTNAIVNYRKSVELNPENGHGSEKLKILTKGSN